MNASLPATIENNPVYKVGATEMPGLSATAVSAVRLALWALVGVLAALAIGQDRIREKSFAAECGGRTADWASVSSRDDLTAALAKIGMPSILKTVRFGYDGKGQWRVESAGQASRLDLPSPKSSSAMRMPSPVLKRVPRTLASSQPGPR